MTSAEWLWISWDVSFAAMETFAFNRRHPFADGSAVPMVELQLQQCKMPVSVAWGSAVSLLVWKILAFY